MLWAFALETTQRGVVIDLSRLLATYCHRFISSRTFLWFLVRLPTMAVQAGLEVRISMLVCGYPW